MATQILLKRCVKREEEEELEKMKKMKKNQCLSSSSSMIQRQSWSDLGSDLLREINKKLPCNYADAIGFRGVCKTWRAAGHVKLAGDVLPWTLILDVNRNTNILSYKLCEPKSFRSPCPIKSDTVPIVCNTINLNHYFKHTRPVLARYVDGWLHVGLYHEESRSLYFLFFCVTTKAPPIILPQLNHVEYIPVFLALSTSTPDSPDCVFVTVCPIDDYTRRIAIFRQCDTHWTITQESVGGRYPKCRHLVAMAGFIRGVLYFCGTQGIASYHLATGALKVDHFAKEFEHFGIYAFFELDGDLILAYNEEKNRDRGLLISKYDWMKKVWVPLPTLGGRCLYITRVSTYVDHINYYGISSANKIYVGDTYDVPRVIEYTLKYGEKPSKCSSPFVRRYDAACSEPLSRWVSPPHLLNDEWSGGSSSYRL